MWPSRVGSLYHQYVRIRQSTLEALRAQLPGLVRKNPVLMCKIWYSIFRTVSDGSLIRANTNDRSTRAFAVKPAPSARRYAAMGLTARLGRAKRLPFPLMKFP